MVPFFFRNMKFYMHCTTLYCTAMYCTTLHCTTLFCTVMHCAALHCTKLNCALHYYALNCTKLHCSALHLTVSLYVSFCIGASISIGHEIWCLPYAGFLDALASLDLLIAHSLTDRLEIDRLRSHHQD